MAAANRLLALKGETRLVRGGRRGAPSATMAFIARGNVAVYRHGVELAARGERAHWVGGLQGYRLEQLLDVWRLRYGHRNEIRDPFLAGFEGYEALTAYAESQDQRDLKAWLGLLERHERCLEVPSEIERVKALALDQPTAGVTSLCTAHKSKGLEFGVVTLADGFPSAETLPQPPKPAGGEDPEAFTYSRSRAPRLWAGDEFLGAVVLAEEELNLRYVAVTRAESECPRRRGRRRCFRSWRLTGRDFPSVCCWIRWSR
jgi:ATP-dependent exoDNAse (exonuclease V) beta subunit